SSCRPAPEPFPRSCFVLVTRPGTWHEDRLPLPCLLAVRATRRRTVHPRPGPLPGRSRPRCPHHHLHAWPPANGGERWCAGDLPGTAQPSPDVSVRVADALVRL